MWNCMVVRREGRVGSTAYVCVIMRAPRPDPDTRGRLSIALHKMLGIDRGVIVQATTYGADHTVVLDGLATAGPNYRGCANAAVLTERDDVYIATLHDAGARGTRFSRQGLGISFSPDVQNALWTRFASAAGMRSSSPKWQGSPRRTTR